MKEMSITREVALEIIDKGSPLRLPKGIGLGNVHPHAIYNPSDDLFPYWLYYTPYPPDEAELPFLVRSRDGYCFTDYGVSNPLINRGPSGSWDDHHLADIDILYHGGYWYMFYAGACYRDNRKIVSIGLATSRDGIHWSKLDKNPILSPSNLWWEKGLPSIIEVSCPTSIYLDGQVYMYYSTLGTDGIYRIALATSSNFIDYEKKGVVLEHSFPWERMGINHPFITMYKDRLIMLYVAYDGYLRYLGLAYTDLSNPMCFTKIDKPILKPSSLLALTGSRNKLLKAFRCINRFLLKKLLKYMKYNIASPFWRGLYIYRSSLLSYPDRRLMVDRENKTLLYISAYDSIFEVPSIGVFRVKIIEE